MTRANTFLIILTVPILTSCEFLGNTLKYKATAKEFAESLLNEDYDKCVDLMAMEHETAKTTNLDTLKKGLANFWQTKINLHTAIKLINSTKYYTDPMSVLWLSVGPCRTGLV